MPFYRNVFETQKTFCRVENKDEIDRSAVFNQRVVSAMRNLSQLIKIADDIFVAIEIECRSVYERTTKLNIKIQHCQGIVNNLNAKAVTVPRASEFESQTQPPFKSSDVKVSTFSSFLRPPAIDKLRDSADGPVVVPSGMVASEVEGFNRIISSSNTSTHVYCRAVKVTSKPRNIVVSGNSNASKKTTSKVPSSVVAIDVSGQPFSRMASFRRSLIHVDFLIRKKQKKDKRRNSVAEGNVKDFVNEDFTLPNSISSYQQIIAKSKNAYNTQTRENQINDKIATERNNNTDNAKSLKKHSCRISAENEAILNEKSINNLSNSELNPEETENSSSKRKPKSHIPISTISAAMNVAVEMRQCNGIRKDTTILNGIPNNTSFGSDIKRKDDRLSNSSLCKKDDESWASYKKRLQDKYKNLTSNRKDFSDNNMSKEIEVSSTASSENVDPQDNMTTMATSTESDTFFISSDESDEDYSDVGYFRENRGSSTSLGTASDESLNSLLSENGTEMTSSTGTLTSVGQEHLLTPPPPPPPMILSATLKDKDLIDKVPDTEGFGIDSTILKGKNSTKFVNVVEKKVKKIKSPKSSKPLKSDFLDLHRNLTENSKNIFTNLVSLKTHAKYKDMGKKKLSRNPHQPAFDMYGNTPTKEKQIPTFIKENISPAIQNEEKSDMKSFCVNDRLYQPSNNEMANTLNSGFVTDKNIHCTDNSNSSDITEAKGIQAVRNIPPKYEHQVTVKPIQRCKEAENKITHDKSSNERENQRNTLHGSMSRQNYWSSENQIYAPKVLRPIPPVMKEKSKAARVVLDYNGRVIYSTNSLDRKHYIPGDNVNSVQNATCNVHLKDLELNNYSCQENHRQQIALPCPATRYSSYTAYPRGKADTFSPVLPQVNYNLKHNESENEPYAENVSYPLDQEYDDQIPSFKWQSQDSENVEIFASNRTDASTPYFYGRHSLDVYSSSPLYNIRDPNISGLPVQEAMLTRHNVGLHLKQMEEMSINTPENRLSNGFCLSHFQKNSGSSLNTSPQSTMSTEDLFAVIHNCKKRMNIKTDPDITVASSSRSSSPSYIRPSSSKSTLAETGFLSPRSQIHLETSGDRKSWADFRPVDSICNERKYLASDRLGPTKPTSMHDFKMLLLQARTSSQMCGPRKSAVEMLKVSSNQSKKKTIASLPLNISPRNSISMSEQNSPTTELSIHNGHSTVPFKRGNRMRASLQPRYIMYPPIFEDCSEDSESCSDIISNKSSSIGLSIENQNATERMG